MSSMASGLAGLAQLIDDTGKIFSSMASGLAGLAQLIDDTGKIFSSISGDIFGTVPTLQLKTLMLNLSDEHTQEEVEDMLNAVSAREGSLNFLQFLTFLARYFKLSSTISEIIKDLGNCYVFMRAEELKEKLFTLKSNLPYISDAIGDIIFELSSVSRDFPITLQLFSSIMTQKWFSK